MPRDDGSMPGHEMWRDAVDGGVLQHGRQLRGGHGGTREQESMCGSRSDLSMTSHPPLTSASNSSGVGMRNRAI